MKEIKCYTPTGYGRYTEGLGTLRASGGDYGGGTEMLIIQRRFSKVMITDAEVSPTLEAGAGGWKQLADNS